MNIQTISELDTIYNQQLNQAHIYQQGNFFALYQPQNIETPEGTITAQVTIYSDNDLTIMKFYSRGWAYWNFLDHTPNPEFAIADEAMETESYLLNHRGGPDQRIIMECLDTIQNQNIPTQNEYWQQMVVRLAYNAITENDALITAAKQAGLTPFDVQKIIDHALFTILGNQNFKLDTFQQIPA